MHIFLLMLEYHVSQIPPGNFLTITFSLVYSPAYAPNIFFKYEME